MAGFTLGLTSTAPALPGARSPFDAAAMTRLAALAIALVRRRTLRGVAADGRPFKGYSTRLLYVGLESETARRLKPKGGTLSRTGRSMRFDGGYREFKALSRKLGGGAGGTAEVDLTLSGELMLSLHVRDVREGAAIIAMSDRTLPYGRFVHDERPFMGLTREDEQALNREAQRIADEWLAGSSTTPAAPGGAPARVTDQRGAAPRRVGGP